MHLEGELGRCGLGCPQDFVVNGQAAIESLLVVPQANSKKGILLVCRVPHAEAIREFEWKSYRLEQTCCGYMGAAMRF